MLKFIIIVLFFILILLVCISMKLYNYALNPHSSKDGILNTDVKDKTMEELWIHNYSEKENVYIDSFDNLKLHAYIIESKKINKWVIVVHGYMSNAESVSSIAFKYHKLGYNLIIPDLRGHGLSEGNYIGMGYHDRLDIIKWIDFIILKDKNSQILLHGFSMGAATVMMVSGEELKGNVKVIIEDCGYTSAKDELSYKLKSMFKMPSFPIMNIVSLICKIKDNYFIEEASPIKQVQKSKVPILFIHGDKDNFVPYNMLNDLYEACNSPKKKLVIEDAGHVKSEKVNEKLYWETVVNFVNNYIKE